MWRKTEVTLISNQIVKYFIYSFFGFLLMILGACKTIDFPLTNDKKITYFVWTRGFHNPSETEIKTRFSHLKNKGIDGIIYSGGRQTERYVRAAKIAKSLDLQFYALMPALIQAKDVGLPKEVYVVNRLGESSYDNPPFPRNHFICPNRPEVDAFLAQMYGRLLEIPEIDGIQLDVIRFPDVILAPALWEKYDLVMDKEYPKYDFCYCDKCKSDFKSQTGIDVDQLKDPSKNKAWRQFRYDVLTKLVHQLADLAITKNKKITAAVFPGPHSVAKKIVRQEWNRWDLDAFFPMNYNDFYLENAAWIGKVCKEAVRATARKKPIYSGLFICPNPANKVNEKDPEYFGLLPEELEEAMLSSIQNGATGICLFTAGRMTEAHWAVFEKVRKKGMTN